MATEISPSRQLELNFDRYEKEEIRRALRLARQESTNPKAVDTFLRLVNDRLRNQPATP